jgi:hypothetical protein
MVLLVNCKSHLDGAITSGELLFHHQNDLPTPQRSRVKATLIITCIMSYAILGLNYMLPVIVALIPSTSHVLFVPSLECGLSHNLGNISYITTNSTMVSMAKRSQLANAAFSVVDGNGLGSDRDSGPSTMSLPKVMHSIVNHCPPDVPACSSEHPFTFSANYTLSHHHFAFQHVIHKFAIAPEILVFSLKVTGISISKTMRIINATNKDTVLPLKGVVQCQVVKWAT